MRRRDFLEDDGRTVADMSGLESPGLFGRRFQSSQSEKKNDSGDGGTGGGHERKPWEDAPFTWQERLRYMGMALGAALLIAVILLAGIALIIWLFTLYA